MNTYLLIFRMPAPTGTSQAPSPAAIQARKDWFATLKAEGRIVNPGATLAPSPARIIQAGTTPGTQPSLTDGTLITGYLVISADTIDHAASLAATNPALPAGLTIEVRQLAPFIG